MSTNDKKTERKLKEIADAIKAFEKKLEELLKYIKSK